MNREPSLLIPVDRARLYANNFDALRLAMALLVVWSHCFALYFGSERSEPLSRLTAGFYNSGNVGVWVFFIISGFLITQSFERSSTIAGYMAKRVRRIYPAYLVATSVCAFVVTPLFVADPAFVLTPLEIVRTLGANLLLANHFPVDPLFAGNPVGAVNGSLWSIRFEFLCYIGVLLLGLCGLLARRHLVLLLYATLVAIWCWLDATGQKPGISQWLIDTIGWPYRWLWVLPNFLAGMLLWLYRDHVRRSSALLLTGIAACLTAFHLPVPPIAATIASHILVPPVMAYAVLWVAFHPALPLHRAGRFGDFSYGTYLYAYVIQQMLIARLAIGFAPFVLLSFACSLLAGVASWYLVERRFLIRKPVAEA